jgi:hypothetical protein
MSEEGHFVEILRVYATGNASDGWHTEPGWRSDERLLFIATCSCGWESAMREVEEEAFEDGRAHKPGSEPVRWNRPGGRFPT